jgi:G:T-mismatch repair DNA endonuclease (very short patch repair protein)
MERTQLLENAGYKVDAIWECEWNNINNMDIINKKNLENIARD